MTDHLPPPQAIPITRDHVQMALAMLAAAGQDPADGLDPAQQAALADRWYLALRAVDADDQELGLVVQSFIRRRLPADPDAITRGIVARRPLS